MRFESFTKRATQQPVDPPLTKAQLNKIKKAFPEISKIDLIGNNWVYTRNDYYDSFYYAAVRFVVPFSNIKDKLKKASSPSLEASVASSYCFNLAKEIAEYVKRNIKTSYDVVGSGSTADSKTKIASGQFNFHHYVDERDLKEGNPTIDIINAYNNIKKLIAGTSKLAKGKHGFDDALKIVGNNMDLTGKEMLQIEDMYWKDSKNTKRKLGLNKE